MPIIFSFTTASFIIVSYVHLSFSKVAGLKTIVYLKLRSPDVQPIRSPTKLHGINFAHPLPPCLFLNQEKIPSKVDSYRPISRE